MKISSEHRFIKNITDKPLFLGITVILFLLSLSSAVTYKIYSITSENKRQSIKNIGELKGRQIELIISHAVTASKTLKLYVEEYPHLSEYQTAVKRIFLAQSDIMDAVELAPNGVIRYVYPFDTNGKAVGFDILSSPEQKKEALEAIDRGEIVFAGPLKLIQGGTGIVGRIPVYTQENGKKVFYGFACVVIRLERILTASGLPSLQSLGYQFQLRKQLENGTTAVFFNENVSLRDPVSIKVQLHNLQWILSIAPVSRWESVNDILPFAVSSALLSLLVGVLVWSIARQPDKLKKLVNEKVAELSESEARFRATFEQAAVGIAHVDLNGGWLRFNQKLCDITGYTREELQQIRFQDLTPPEEIIHNEQGLHDLIERKLSVYEREKMYRKRNGDFVWVDLTVSLLFSSAGTPLYFISIIQDISERKKIEAEKSIAERELRESEIKFKELIHNAPLVLLAVDANGIFTYSDGKGLEGTGLAPGQVVGLDAYQTYGQLEIQVNPGTTLRGDEVIRRVLKGETINGLTELNGTYFDNAFVPHYNDLNEIIGMIGISINITEKFNAEKKSRIGSERYKIMGELTTNILWDWDIVNDTLWWSEEYYSDYTQSKNDSKQVYDTKNSRIHPDDASRVSAGLESVLNSDATEWWDEYRFRKSDNTYIFIQEKARIFRDGDGKAYRMVGGITNIHRQKEYESQLRKAVTSLNTIINSSPAAIFDLTPDGTIRTLWNKSAERIFGRTNEEAIGKSFDTLVSIQQNALTDIIERLGKKEFVNDIEVEWKIISGELRSLLLNIAEVKNETGAVEAYIVVVIDITEKKKMEEQFLRAQRLESIGTLASGIAHDLNNVLAPILLGIEIIKLQTAGNAYVGAALKNMEHSAIRGRDIVRQVLNFGRGGDLEQKPIQLKHLGTEIESLMKETLPKSIQIRTNFPNDLRLVSANFTQLHQVLMNLCINARDAMPDGGVLTISMANRTIDEVFAQFQSQVKPGNYVEISVADSGIGIPKEMQTKIFDPFFTTKEHGKGTGLGLSTVHSIVKNHDGFVKLYSEPGTGTEFKVYIPALEEKNASPAEQHDIMPRGKNEHVLVIDDEQSILEITKQTLEQHGYRVTTAIGGAEAIGIFQDIRGTVSIVITDVNMPVMDGIMTATTLRKINPKLKFILSSGLPEEDHHPKFSEMSFDGFLHKPYTARDLLVCVQHASLIVR